MAERNSGLGTISLAVALLGLVGALVVHFLPTFTDISEPALYTRYASYVAFAAGAVAVLAGLLGRGSRGAGAGTLLGVVLLIAAAAYTVLTYGVETPTEPPAAAAPATGTTP